MMTLRMKPPSSSSLCLLCFFLVFFSCRKSTAQNATTDPSEVNALSSILQQWKISTLWNPSTPCSRNALDQDDYAFDNDSSTNNLTTACDCSVNNRTLCHITRLKVAAQNAQGVIPKELLDLPFLTFLKIDDNFLTGLLPAFIGNMSRLKFLSIANNDLSGPIPKELGNLKELNLLSIGNNNFSGTLPPELGNLVNLKDLQIHSCRVGGEIPSTFANLRNLKVVWASDNAFTGKIPNFIGNNWTKLVALRFEGNSFEGPIPSSFANLTSLRSLRIEGIYNGSSSSLHFVRNLASLTDLVLRNVLLNGTIPSYITKLQSLWRLDLNFNNLTGQIPSDLFNMSSLEHLFLGNNSLSGRLPSQKNETLKTIDLSYNWLSGNLPSWINSGSQVNLVANNFSRDSIGLLRGQECLQRSFQCNRNTPRYENLSINCGGPPRTYNGNEFEGDSETLGAATVYVANTQKWAVSNVGWFAERENQQYVQSTGEQVRNTTTEELYQTSRISPGSLRYYGLGLENGPYNITLFFAETGFPDRSTRSSRSLARRAFDVYIQGTRQLRDFDISKEAGGVEIAITKNFTANVTENHLEIHLFWAGKGTCCIPEEGHYGPSISAVSVFPNFKPPSGKEKNQTILVVGIAVPVAIISLVVLILIFAIIYVKRRKDNDHDHDHENVLLAIGPRANTFSYAELKAASEDFSPSNKLGEGGFGAVYKGTLSDGRAVAVKQLSVASHHGKNQFIAEVATISAVQHRNLVKLYGCCIEGNRHLLVYEYLENRSLDQALFGWSGLHLDWSTRFSICLATARGLAYLHEDSHPRIVHRDIKASNILLDAELCPKISDFGLAKLYDDKNTHISTRVAGTM
ncbi:hypothetical protein DITRI_Ditri19aG0074900 [Diplodiscus trichospermus]